MRSSNLLGAGSRTINLWNMEKDNKKDLLADIYCGSLNVCGAVIFDCFIILSRNIRIRTSAKLTAEHEKRRGLRPLLSFTQFSVYLPQLQSVQE